MDRDCDQGEGEGEGYGLPEIPVEAWEMIKRVKDIVSHYTENEIYAMLLECDMDPNVTVQRLLSQDPFETVKGKQEKRKEKKIAGEKRLHDIGSSSDFGGRGGSHQQSENTSYRGESGDSADAEYKRQSIGTDASIPSAQSSQVLQHAWSGARGRASMADVVRMGGLGARGRTSMVDVARMGRPGANTSSLPITSTGTSPPPVGAVTGQCGQPDTSSLPIALYETSFPLLGTAPERSSYRVTTPPFPPLVEAEPHQDLHSQNPCDRAEIPQDRQPDEVQASVSNEQLAEHSAAVSSAAAGLEKPSMEKGQTLVLPDRLQVPDADRALVHFGSFDIGLPSAYSSLHKLNRLQSELGEGSGAPVDDSSVGNLDFRNPEDHGDEQPRFMPGADRENSASSCARERQWIRGPSRLRVAHADSDSQPRSFLEATEHSSASSCAREREWNLGHSRLRVAVLGAQSQSSRYSSGGSYSSRPINFMSEDVRPGTFSVPGLPSQAVPGIHIAPGTTLPRPFASDPDNQHSVSLEHLDNTLADPSPPQSYASIPSAFQQSHTGEGSSHPLPPELMEIILQYGNRAPMSHLAQPPAGDGSFRIPTNIPPAGHRSFGSPTNVPPAGHGSFWRPINISPTGHQTFGSPAYIRPARLGSFGSLTNIPIAGHGSFGSPTNIRPARLGSFGSLTNIPIAGHGSFGSPTNIPPTGHRSFRNPPYIPSAGYGSFGSPSNIPSRFLHNLDEFLSPHEGVNFNPRQVGSSATWVRGPGGSRATSPAPGSTHYYGLRGQNIRRPSDEGGQRLLRQPGSQGYQTPDQSQSRGSQRQWRPRSNQR